MNEQLINLLMKDGVDAELLNDVSCPINNDRSLALSEDLKARIPTPECPYYGREIWEAAIAALLSGRNLLLSGPKATGKNILCENLAALFERPVWDVSFHVGMDAASMIGADSFDGSRVVFKPGPVYLAGKYGGFAVLDEINMAKNEALASRFLVIAMPIISEENLCRVLEGRFPTIRKSWRDQFVKLFYELNDKAEHAEISERAVDLRGLQDAIGLMQLGISIRMALDMGIVNKCFDPHEQQLIRDVITVRIPDHGGREVFD